MDSYSWQGRPRQWRQARKQYLFHYLWEKANKADGIPADSLFVVVDLDDPLRRLDNNLRLSECTPVPSLP